MRFLLNLCCLIGMLFISFSPAFSQTVEPGEEVITTILNLGVDPPTNAPARGAESEGPFSKLVIKGVFMLDGTGAPVQGLVDITIEQDRIVKISGTGTDAFHLNKADYGDDIKIIDATGKFVLPGFIDAHTHLGTPTHAMAGSLTHPEYVLKLWLAHRITTVRETGALMGLNWTLDHKIRSERGEIAAPRIMVHALFPGQMKTPAMAKAWIQAVQKKGADGIKFLGLSPNVIEVAIKEAKRLMLNSCWRMFGRWW